MRQSRRSKRIICKSVEIELICYFQNYCVYCKYATALAALKKQNIEVDQYRGVVGELRIVFED